MKYLEMVILEALRLYPSVPAFGRELAEGLTFDGQDIPKGINVLIPAYAIHRDPKYYENPEKFDPERFTTENKSKRKPFCYFPFSAGPRNCIGQKFAMLEIKSTVSKILRHYELLEVSDFKPILSMEAIIKSSNGVLIAIKERKY